MKKKAGIIILVLIVVGGLIFKKYYGNIYNSNTAFEESEKELFVHTGSTYEDLLYDLETSEILKDLESFKNTADLKKFDYVKPGRYVLKKGMSNNDIINKLRIGDQDAVNVTFNNARKLDNVAGKIAYYLELDSALIQAEFGDSEVQKKFGFNSYTFPTMFIPNTYQMNWDINKDDLLQRFAKEYKAFWNEERLSKARALNLSQSEVTILASIVKAETSKTDEAPKVAGLYINRIRRKMPLQSDPTLIFALGDFSIKRVLNKHKEINSPYNTYKNGGLPPGPINIPSPVYIDAVLNYEDHDYIFMCAKADFSGYHHFAKTNAQHEVYAAEYRRALNRAGIYR